MKPSMIALAVMNGLQAEANPQANGGSGTSGGAAKRPAFCKKDDDDAFDGKGDVVYFRFANGTVLEFDLQKVPEDNRRLLALHGAEQKIGDSYAGVKGDFSKGIQNAQDVINTLYSGEWTQEREGGGPRLAELAEAIARIKGAPVEKVREVVEAATPEERSAWRSNATVKATVAQMRAEKAQAALDAQGDKKEDININLGGQ